MLDERKTDIYSHVPSQYLPQTRLLKSPNRDVLDSIEQDFSFPVFLKPNIGYKGFLVKKVDSKEQLEQVVKEYEDKEFLVQEFLSEPKEYSVMYYFIDEQHYGISSLVEKYLPVITGDGVRTIQELIEKLNNPFLKKSWILKKNKNILTTILAKGESFTIDHVGNYSRGSKFENLNSQIDTELIEAIHDFFRKVKGMHFCRIDLKANSLCELRKGKFKLLEINGAKSEPLHIYDSNISFFSILYAVHVHWTTLFKIVKKNIKLMDFPSSREGIKSYYSLKKLVN